jgi:hypothetical protein
VRTVVLTSQARPGAAFIPDIMSAAAECTMHYFRSVLRGAVWFATLFATCTLLLRFPVSNKFVVEPNRGIYTSFSSFMCDVPAVSCMADSLTAS